VIVFKNDLQTNSKLMQIIDALSAMCLCLGGSKRWQK
jgi:hypothetical protein